MLRRECSACGKRLAFGAENPGRAEVGSEGVGEPDRLGPQMALESVHVINGAGGGAALDALGERHGRGPAARALLLAAGQERAPGVRVAPLIRDD